MFNKIAGQNVFCRVENELRRMILSNELSEDLAIPTENELCKKYEISRNTLRKALANLVSDGLLYKVQGRGTYVTPIEQRKSIKQVSTPMVRAYIPSLDVALSMYDKALISGFFEYKLACNSEIDFTSRGLYGLSVGKILDEFYEHHINGIIWERPYTEQFPIIEELHNHKVPQVMISRTIPGIPSINFDSEKSLNDAVDFLVSIGHKDIYLIDIDAPFPIFRRRNMAFLDSLRRNKIKAPEGKLLLVDWHDRKLNFRDLEEKLNKYFDGTAVIVGSYFVERLFGWAERKGVRVPDELTIISITSLNANELTNHHDISAIIDPRREIGRKAMEICHDLINGKQVSLLPEKIAGELLIRKTCRPPHYLAKLLSEI